MSDNGEAKARELSKENIVVGIIIEDGKLTTYCNGKFFQFLPQSLGILMMEIPNMFRYFQAKKMEKEQSQIITPEFTRGSN